MTGPGMTPIPTRILLGPHAYEVRSDPDTARLLRDEDSNGDSRPDSLLIRVDPDRPHTTVAETLLHEAMHCAWAHTPLGTVHDPDAEEQIVAALAPLLLEALRRNPELAAHLTA